MIQSDRVIQFPRLGWILSFSFVILLMIVTACSPRSATVVEVSPDNSTNGTISSQPANIQAVNIEEAPSVDLEPAPKVGHPAPDFTLVNLAGELVSLSDFRGQPVIVNFWATWCGPCRLEMPHLQDSFVAHQDDGLVILAVNLTKDDDPDAIPAFIEEFGLTFPVILDEAGEMRQLYQLLGQPASVFIDRNGVITEYWQGPINLPFIEERLAKIL